MAEPAKSQNNQGAGGEPRWYKDVFKPLNLDLVEEVKDRLRMERIYVDWRMSCEMQRQSKQWVIRATESGGAVGDIGYYLGYCGLKGERLRLSYELATLTFNGMHAVVVAPELVKVEMLRIDRNYQLMLSRHVRTAKTKLDKKTGKPRRWILNYLQFISVHGSLDLELWGKDKKLSGLVEPVFKNRLGEIVQPPEAFLPAVRAATQGVNTLKCRKALLLSKEAVDWQNTPVGQAEAPVQSKPEAGSDSKQEVVV